MGDSFKNHINNEWTSYAFKYQEKFHKISWQNAYKMLFKPIRLKRTLKKPIVILEQSSEERNYVFLTKDLNIHTVNVVFKDNIWYADSLNV